MIAVDTNILVYAHRAGAPEHAAAQRAIERAASTSEGWGVTQTSLAEFWCQVTHPRYTGGPSRPEQAAGFLRAIISDGGARILVPAGRFHDRLLDAACRLGVGGPRIFDLQIAITALDSGARQLWTHDRGFVPLPGLKVVDPL
jgi:uncharacterized protein